MSQNCGCCGNNTWFIGISQILDKINNTICGIGQSIECLELVNPNDIKDIKRMLAHNNPMTVSAEYPTEINGRYVVSTNIRFLDMLNTDLFIIFKIDRNDLHLPMYFKDSVEYEHAIVLPNGNPVYLNGLQLNGIYSAKYQYTGGFIILDNLIPLNPDIIIINNDLDNV